MSNIHQRAKLQKVRREIEDLLDQKERLERCCLENEQALGKLVEEAERLEATVAVPDPKVK